MPVTDKIDVSSLCSGDGSSSNSWILNESVLITAIKSLTNTTKTIWFKTGHYYSSSTIHIDFGQIFKDNPNKYSLFREGLSIIGDTNTKIQFATIRGQNVPSLHIEWTSPSGQVGLFFWEISGLHIGGDNDNELVRIGSYNANTMAWNSCTFLGLVINNGYIKESDNNNVSQAIGIIMVRVLQSRLDIVATCAQGIGAVFQNMEFSVLISGSFSNAQVNGGKTIYNNSVGLKLI
eukprot:872251_1